MTTIAVGCDHAGYNLKTHLAEHLKSLGYDVLDLGSYSADRVDYPEYGAAVGRAVASGEAKYGVCVCGSGVGISIAANKISGVRAALVSDAASAELSRQHNDANVLCFGERSIEFEVADRLVAFGLVSPEAFEGVTAADLVGLGFDQDTSDLILEKVSTGENSSE